ncbi:flavoprotein [Streptomyces sp. NPDC056465]|uniref:flavoprotein n=1 Tax=Streptomyces sp. NPDC056465 TaxID=3345829 RepID=UPI0036CEE071
MSGRLLLGVTGSSAASSVPSLLNAAAGRGWNVKVVATPHAEPFLSHVQQHVHTNAEWRESAAPLHLELLQDIDAFLIAPATANTIGACAQGLAGNLLTALVLAHKPPVHFWPTMNRQMWRNPAVQHNVRKLSMFRHHVLPPDPSPSLTTDHPTAAVGPISGTVLDHLAHCSYCP